jgi:hypothetical protein
VTFVTTCNLPKTDLFTVLRHTNFSYKTDRTCFLFGDYEQEWSVKHQVIAWDSRGKLYADGRHRCRFGTFFVYFDKCFLKDKGNFGG